MTAKVCRAITCPNAFKVTLRIIGEVVGSAGGGGGGGSVTCVSIGAWLSVITIRQQQGIHFITNDGGVGGET